MKILALEFSSSVRSVSVSDSAGSVPRILSEISQNAPRHVTGISMIDRALSEARISPAEIEVLAVGLGPGSYAGIRSAIAIAQGWQLAREIRLLGISSVEVLAAEAARKGLKGRVSLIIDAQRRECYEARYEITSAGHHPLGPLRIVPLAELDVEKIVAGPDAPLLVPGAQALYPAATTLARLAACRSGYDPGEKLEPIYLRETAFVKAPLPRIHEAPENGGPAPAEPLQPSS